GRSAGVDALGREEGFGQLLSPQGRVLASTPGMASVELLPAKHLPRARKVPVFYQVKHLRGISGQARLIARPMAPGGDIVVAGTSLKDRERANESLLRALVIGVPIALFLASLAGYGL